MKKVLAIGLLFVQLQSFGQSLHANYKAQLNKNIPINIKEYKIHEQPDQLENKKLTPKYRKNVVNISTKVPKEKINKHLNYKHHASSISLKIE
ncbi:MAG: hypothetical protein RI995_705 [Bacteroidota bacterium]|jgi:hypothetical protein